MGQVRLRVRWIVALVGLSIGLLSGSRAADPPKPGDDATYRPTVMIRRGKSLGTGTIISSIEDDTLVLTASHVVAGSGPVLVEVFRYNFGVERVQALSGFPRRLPASVVARDVDADLAILRIRGQLEFPHVARIAKGDDPPASGTEVTTIGFDRGAKLIGFSTKVRSLDRIDLDKGGGHRSFLVTEDPPEVGRSGGGLFLADGSLVGVCVGKVELAEGRVYGLFSPLGSVKGLVRSDADVAASMIRARDRSKARERSPNR